MVRAAAIAVVATALVGCDVPSFLDPTELTPGSNYKTGPALQKPILNSLSSIDKTVDDSTEPFANVTDVRPEDLQSVAMDYVIGKSDVITIEITDLVGPGVQTTKTTRVSESGNVSLPLIGQVHAAGLTEPQLEQAIAGAYRNAQIIQNAQVSVTVAEADARTFSILGAIGAPGRYVIAQSDFRMLDALVLARDVTPSVNIDEAYVIRQLDQDPGNAPAGQQPSGGMQSPPATPTTPGTGGDPLAPRSQANPAPGDTVKNLMLLQQQQPTTTSDAAPAGAPPAPAMQPAAPAAAPMPTPTPAAAPGSDLSNNSAPFQFAAPTPQPDTRTIRINLDALRNGDLRYNIVIRPHDLIVVPQPVVGEYYMGGHIARVGVYALTNRKITLKQAVIGAGMFDGLAIPERTELIRRVGGDREVAIRVDLASVFAGAVPDIYLKPYDQVMVGTNILAPFAAAVRGGFRITYGFGFLYDRNFAPAQNNQGL